MGMMDEGRWVNLITSLPKRPQVAPVPALVETEEDKNQRLNRVITNIRNSPYLSFGEQNNIIDAILDRRNSRGPNRSA